jgi:biopolymer transport protein ExbD
MAAFALPARRARYAAAAEPNVIPFIDVLLVLLVIFMVTAPKPTTDLRLDLPRPGPAQAIVIPPTIVELNAAPGGGYRVLISGLPSSLDAVADDALAHVLAANPVLDAQDALIDARIHVRADLDVRYQDVISVVERLQGAHFQKVAVMAQRAE